MIIVASRHLASRAQFIKCVYSPRAAELHNKKHDQIARQERNNVCVGCDLFVSPNSVPGRMGEFIRETNGAFRPVIYQYYNT